MKKYTVDHIWQFEELGLVSPILKIGRKNIKPKKFIVDHHTYKEVNHHAYCVGSLVFCLFNTNHFIIYEASTKKSIAVTDTFSTSFNKVLEGFYRIATYCPDWNVLADEIKEDKGKAAEMLKFLIETYEQYFGAYWDYSIFGRRFQEDMSRVVRATKALNNAPW